jgi:hypothetical protein
VNGNQIGTPGTFFLFAELNGTFAFAETSDANNVMAAASSVTVTAVTVVDNSSAGFSTTGSAWLSYTGAGYDNNFIYSPGNTGSTASWTVSGLAAGNYNVEMSWVAFTNRATNVTYSIYNNGVLLETVNNVNQQLTPTGGATINGTPFQSLGVVSISSGTLTVTVTDNANGYIIADAILVLPD